MSNNEDHPLKMGKFNIGEWLKSIGLEQTFSGKYLITSSLVCFRWTWKNVINSSCPIVSLLFSPKVFIFFIYISLKDFSWIRKKKILVTCHHPDCNKTLKKVSSLKKHDLRNHSSKLFASRSPNLETSLPEVI